MRNAETIDELGRLTAGEKPAWDRFVKRHAGVIAAAIRAILGPGEDIDDIAQDVFVRLCKDDFRLLRQYDPSRSRLTTWLTIVARSVASDFRRRKRPESRSIDDVPEGLMAVQPHIPEHLTLPADLLTARQALVLTMLYDREMETHEVAAVLGIDPQTVRSTHHKALIKLRAHFHADKV